MLSILQDLKPSNVISNREFSCELQSCHKFTPAVAESSANCGICRRLARIEILADSLLEKLVMIVGILPFERKNLDVDFLAGS